MKVSEFIEILKVSNPDAIVIMSSDAEGNSYSPLSECSVRVYSAINSWDGEVGYAELTPEAIHQGYDEEDLITDGEPAIVLYPAN